MSCSSIIEATFMAGGFLGQSESSLATAVPRTLRGRGTPSFRATRSNPAWFLKHSISASRFRSLTFCQTDVASWCSLMNSLGNV